MRLADKEPLSLISRLLVFLSSLSGVVPNWGEYAYYHELGSVILQALS
jgi:hypothetical protein